MSFAERNKRWLLPTLGTAGMLVLWMNRPVPAPVPAPPPPAVAPESAVEAPPPQPAFGDDLRALEAPPALDPAPLLEAGRHALRGQALKPAPPSLHPELWGSLFQAAPARVRAPQAPVAAGPLPALDFVIEKGARREAWVRGRGYAPGATLPSGYTVKSITTRGVVAAGPAGDVELRLGPGAKATQREGVHP